MHILAMESLTISKKSVWKYASFILGVLIVIGVFVVSNPSSAKKAEQTGNVVQNAQDVQKITLGIRNYNYAPNTITVKAGKPVSITLDNSVTGCLRSFTISELGVKGYSASPAQTIDFTPTKKGTFKFACSMGMGYGTIVVE